MSSNLLKGGFVNVAPDEKVTINSNAFVEKKIEELMRQLEDENPEDIEEGFVEGLDPAEVQHLISEPSESVLKAPDFSMDEINQMTTQAQAQADEIIEAAQQEAEQIRADAKKQGHAEGYEEGRAAAEEESRTHLEQLKAQLQAEYDEKAQALEVDFEKRCAELEPLLVDKLADIYARVTSARLEADRDTVCYLLNRALTSVESGRTYLVHVAAPDYEEVKSRKEEIAKGTGLMPENFDIVEDMTLAPGACLIESEAGIWDCSLGTQLKLLTAQLKILSYEP